MLWQQSVVCVEERHELSARLGQPTIPSGGEAPIALLYVSDGLGLEAPDHRLRVIARAVVDDDNFEVLM